MIITRKVACLGTIEDFNKFTNSYNLGVSYIGKPKAMDINGTCYYIINNDTDFENTKFDQPEKEINAEFEKTAA